MNDVDHTGNLVSADGWNLTRIRLPKPQKFRPCKWYRRHRWSRWDTPRVAEMYHGGILRKQDRTCARCNKIEERTI